jgi:hypothetical protein
MLQCLSDDRKKKQCVNNSQLIKNCQQTAVDDDPELSVKSTF